MGFWEFLGRFLAIQGLRSNPITICCLGRKYVGKSCFYNFMNSKNEIPDRANSYGAQPVNDFKIKANFKLIKVTGCQDISGADDFVLGNWKSLIEKSNVVIYLVQSDRYISDDYDNIKRVNSQLCLVSSFVEAKNEKQSSDANNKEYKPTKLLIIPTWKRALLKKNQGVEKFNRQFHKYLMTNAMLKNTVILNDNAMVDEIRDFVMIDKHQKELLNKKDLNAVCEKIIELYYNKKK